MKTYQLKQNLKQNYGAYTSEDFLVWKTLFERQTKQLQSLAASEYLNALNEIEFNATEIPNFDKTNRLLLRKTGWSLVVVEGIIGEIDFFTLLANKKFPATTWLRKLSELDYLSEPDMFHDVFGHVPLLINKNFSNFFNTIGKIGLKNIQHPEIIQMLGRLYWFTVEFGLIKKSETLQIYGAGIISSHGESNYAINSKPKHKPFCVNEIMNTPFENDKIQETYFVINSFQALYNSVSTINKTIADKTLVL